MAAVEKTADQTRAAIPDDPAGTAHPELLKLVRLLARLAVHEAATELHPDAPTPDTEDRHD